MVYRAKQHSPEISMSSKELGTRNSIAFSVVFLSKKTLSTRIPFVDIPYQVATAVRIGIARLREEHQYTDRLPTYHVEVNGCVVRPDDAYRFITQMDDGKTTLVLREVDFGGIKSETIWFD